MSDFVSRERNPVLHSHSRWVPARWDAVHEQMVALSCRGMSNVAIADLLGYTAQQVSNVINTPQGQELIAQYKAELRKKLMESADTRMDELQVRAVENVHKVLNDKDLLQDSPFQMLRASMEYLKGVGKMVGNAPVINTGDTIQNNTIVSQQTAILMKEEQLSKLVAGVERATKVLAIHTREVEENDAESKAS